jgi:hypothetical protein
MMRAIISAIVLVGSSAAAEPKITKVSIEYTYQSFHRNALSYAITWSGGAYRAGKRVIDTALVDALVASLTDLRTSDRELSCTSHFDDYPRFQVAIGDNIVLSSSSNCHSHVPWNVVRDGKRFVQLTGAADRALLALLVEVDPDKWRTGPDAPEATMSLGREQVVLDEYKAGDSASTPAAACANDLEASARAKKLIGAAPHVSELVLLCDLAASRDCTATTATATFVWAGLEARVELPCSGGRVTIDELETLRPFVHSKPVRLVTDLSKDQPRMWQAWGIWQVEGGVEVPRLQYKPGGTIEARALDEHPPAIAFWKKLHIDASKLTHKDDTGWYETSAKLDLAGRLVP